MDTTQTMEEFWGAALSKSKKEIEWETEDDEDDSLHFEKHLELRQACLGVGAKEGERNVVEVTTDDEEGNKVSYTILSMRLGGTEQSSLFVTLQPPVKFRLVEGSGPVHLVGQVTETIDLDMLNSDEDDDDDDEEEEEAIKSAPKIQAPNKRPASSPSKAPSSKVSKMDDWDEDEDDSEEDEDSEEEDEDEEMSDEDEEEEESDEEEVKPPPKKSQSNGKQKTDTPHSKGKSGPFKTPQPTNIKQKGSSVPQKGSKSLPNTPKAMSDKKAQNKKKTPSGKGTPDLNEIKERLTKMSVPKKLEKFNNFISNSFKIKDQSITKQLWEYVQKNRPEK